MAPPFPLLTPTTTVGGRGVSAEDPLCAPHSHALHQNPSPRAPGCGQHPPLLTSCGHHHTASALLPCSPAHPPKGSPPAGLTPEGFYTPLRPSRSEPAVAPFSLPGKASILGPLFPRPAVPSPHHPTLNLVPTLPLISQPQRPYSGQVASTPLVPSDYNTCEDCRRGVTADLQ